jgi:hypothetical protein
MPYKKKAEPIVGFFTDRMTLSWLSRLDVSTCNQHQPAGCKRAGWAWIGPRPPQPSRAVLELSAAELGSCQIAILGLDKCTFGWRTVQESKEHILNDKMLVALLWSSPCVGCTISTTYLRLFAYSAYSHDDFHLRREAKGPRRTSAGNQLVSTMKLSVLRESRRWTLHFERSYSLNKFVVRVADPTSVTCLLVSDRLTSGHLAPGRPLPMQTLLIMMLSQTLSEIQCHKGRITDFRRIALKF